MITLEKALALIAAGEEEARQQELALAFAVVDAGGHLVASQRMDGTPWIAPEVAIGKAWTAAAYGAPSAAQGEKMRELHAFSAAITRRRTAASRPRSAGCRSPTTAAPWSARWARAAAPASRTRTSSGRRCRERLQGDQDRRDICRRAGLGLLSGTAKMRYGADGERRPT
jgi:glc operon protein GlcG